MSFLKRVNGAVTSFVASGTLVAFFLLMPVLVMAQDPVSFMISDENADPGSSVTVEWTYTGNDDADGIEGRFDFDDTHITNVDYSACLDGWQGSNFVGQCTDQGGTGDNAFFQLADSGGAPIPSGSGFITFDIAATAPAGTTIDLVWDQGAFVLAGSPTVNSEDGSITISAGPSSVDFTPNPGSTIDFGNAEQGGGTSNDTVQICNDGSTGSVVNVDSVSISPAQFTQDGNCDGAAISDGTCCTIGLTFAPDGTGTFNGSLAVETDAESGEGTNGDASFSLTGEGVAGPAPNLSIAPTSWTTNTDSGTTTAQTFTVENSGDASSEADIGTVGLATGSEFTITADNCSSTTLTGGTNCTIDVEFGPSMAGTFNDTLNVPATDAINGGDESLSASLEGTGNGPMFASNPAPGTINLGQTPPGGTLNQDVQITNEGNEPLDASCGTLNDPDGVFTLTPSPADFTGIAGGASESFNVACTVPDVSNYEATLQCSTNEGTEGEVYDYTFRCSGQPLIIPTMQPWGLVLLTMLMLMVGGLSIRYFRV